MQEGVELITEQVVAKRANRPAQAWQLHFKKEQPI